MIREHIFKAKRKDNGKWIEGWFLGAERTANIIDDNHDIFPVDPDTVCEYTGKQDKNKTKIFEGDIVAFYFFDKGTKNTRTMLIEWIDSGFCMKELFRDYRLTSDFNIVTEKIYTYKGEIKQGIYKSNNSYFVEVIGNIFDNKELLNGN